MIETIWTSCDLGNDGSKINFDFKKKNVVVPSVVGEADANLEKATFDTKEAMNEYMKNFLSEAIFSVASSSVNSSNRYYLDRLDHCFGRR